MSINVTQRSWNAGELAPTLLGRDELEQSQHGAEKLRNVVVSPHGGVKRRPGLAFQEEIMKKTYKAYTVAGWTSGKTIGHTLDISSFPEIYDAGHSVYVNTDFLCVRQDKEYGTETNALYTMDPSSITYVHPGVLNFGNNYLRNDDVVYIINNREESEFEKPLTGANDTVKIFDFEFSTTQKYLMVAAQFSMSMYRDEGSGYVRQAIKAMPWGGIAVPFLSFTQSLDTLLVFHKHHNTQQVTRGSTHSTWNRENYEYKNIPWYEFEDIYSPDGTSGPASVARDHVEDMTLRHFNEDGIAYSMWANGEKTDRMLFYTGSTHPANSSSIRNALLALEGVEGVATTDITVAIEWAVEAGNIYRITMTGLNRKKWTFAPTYEDYGHGKRLSQPFRIKELIFNTFQEGWGEREAVWSEIRGWPRCGTYFENRLWVGGSYSLPSTVWSSRAGTFEDFNNVESDADYGITHTMNASDVAAVYNIHIGRHFHALTSSSEYYATISDTEGMTPENFYLRRNTQRGSQEGIRAIDVSGSVMFVGRFGKTIQELSYERRQQAYSTVNVAKLSPQVLNSPVSMSYSQSVSTDSADYIYVVNSDGTLAIFNTMREDGVNAWSLCSTTGDFISSAVVDVDSLFAVRRDIGGTNGVFLERFDEALYMDSGERGTTAVSSTTGVAHLTGETLDLLVDGSTQSQVIGASTTNFGSTADTSWQLGLPFPDVSNDGSGKQVIVKLLPLQPNPQNSIRGDLSSVVDVSVRLYKTSHIEVQLDDGIVYPFPIRSFGTSLLDEPVPVYTGVKEIEGLQGYSESAQLTFSQSESLPFMILGVTMKVDI